MSTPAEEILREFRQQQQQELAQPETAADIVREYRGGTEAAAQQLLQADLDMGNYAPKGLRWSLARGDNLEEKRLRLAKRFPDGELEVLPQSNALGFESDALIWRESPQSQWKFVEPQGFDAFDIPEAIAPSAESIAAETMVAAVSGGSSVPVAVFRQAGGAMAGEVFEQAMQSARGLQAQTPGEMGGEVAFEGGMSALGGFLASPFVALYNITRGAGALRVGEEGLDIMRAANEINPDIAGKLTPGMVSDNPAIRTSEKQAAALLPGLNRRYREVISMVDSAVRSQSAGNAKSAMQLAVEQMKAFSDYFLAKLPVFGTKASAGGEAIQQGIQEYSVKSNNIVNGLYNRARSIAEPEFDMDPVMKLADDLRAGSSGQLDPAVEAQIKNLETITGPIPLSESAAGVPRELSVTDQLRNIRTKLWDLKQADPGKPATQENRQARLLYGAITDMLDNPTNADPIFREAWSMASQAAGKRLQTLELAPIVASACSSAPSELVRAYVKPGNVENLLAIRGTLPQKQWDEFVDSAYTQLLADPGNLDKTLRAFDQETLDAFMPRAHQESFQRIATELSRINSLGVEAVAEQQVRNRNFVDALINGASPRDTQTLIRAFNNTNNSAARDSVRAALIEWSWDGVVETTKQGLKINSQLVDAKVQALKSSEMWSLLTPDQRRLVSNVKVISTAFERVADAGTALIAASAVQSVKRAEMSGIMTFVTNHLVGQFYMSSLGRQVLIGGGAPNTNGAMLRAVAGALAQTSAPVDISQLVEDDE